MKLENITNKDLDRLHLSKEKNLHNNWELYSNNYLSLVIRENYIGDTYSVGYINLKKDYQLNLYGLKEWQSIKK